MATIIQGSAFAGHAQPGLREEPVNDSGWISKFKYDAQQMILTVTLKSGAEYAHYMVYPQTFEDLMQAPSKGAFYAKNIKGNGLSQSLINKKVGERNLHEAHVGKILPKGRKSHG